jgi:hypothetical protein
MSSGVINRCIVARMRVRHLAPPMRVVMGVAAPQALSTGVLAFGGTGPDAAP